MTRLARERSLMIAAMISSTTAGASPSKGSSSRMRRVGAMSTRAIATICRSPPDRFCAFASRLADTVAAEDGDHLTPPHLQVDAVKNPAARITSAQTGHLEDWRRRGSGPRQEGSSCRRSRTASTVPFAEIRGNHLGIPRDLSRCAVCNETAVVQDRDPIGYCQHTIDVVLDQEYRVLLTEA